MTECFIIVGCKSFDSIHKYYSKYLQNDCYEYFRWGGGGGGGGPVPVGGIRGK